MQKVIHLNDASKTPGFRGARKSGISDIMVSIRMPKSLAHELKQLTLENHFLDLSEQVRSIVRKKWIEAISPALSEVKKLREGIEEEIRKKSSLKVQEEVAKELEKIKEQLKKGGFLG